MDRKEMIKAMEQHFGVKAKYMGAPGFKYQIEINSELYTIDKDGVITTNSGVEIEYERLLHSNAKEDIMDIQENSWLELKIPIEGHTGQTLRNLINMIYSKKVLIKKVFEFEDDIIDKDFIIAIKGSGTETLEDFQRAAAGMQEEGKNGIYVDFRDKTIRFKFCKSTVSPEKLDAYAQFIAMLNKCAKEIKHASYKPTATDNEKFTMRTWLIRLGFIGPEFKASRKILLENLSGNGAFRQPKTLEAIAAEQ